MDYSDAIKEILSDISELDLEDKISAINAIREEIHKISPFKTEPVDCVLWVKSESVKANDYNPNSVAPPEMQLLEHSIAQDGYTQPIVSWVNNGHFEVVDGFHRNRVGKESAYVSERIKGFLPVTVINPEREKRGDRIASTIRHNRARGKHNVDSMSDIVVELKRRNWTNSRISRELGMDEDEILRLCQITGLSELFSDEEFSRAWDVEGCVTEDDFEELTDDPDEYIDPDVKVQTANTSDPERIFHTYEKWECHKAGFYKNTIPNMTKEECEKTYRDFLTDSERFKKALEGVTTEWKNSCEHYLTNRAMNRIAWLGQAAACYDTGIPSSFRSGFNLLTEKEQEEANEIALEYLNKWLENKGMAAVSMEEAYTGRQSDIY
jgi:ParB-like chromosome segregation protein Spo0J